MSGAERKHLPTSLRWNPGGATSEVPRYVEFNDRCHDHTLLAYHSQPHLQRTESERWSLLRNDLQIAHDLVHMTLLLLLASEFFVRCPPLAEPESRHVSESTWTTTLKAGALAIAIVVTQQVPGRVLLQDRPDEIVPKTSVETMASCQAVDTVMDFGALGLS
jgi:hypothetical protein